MTIAAPALLAVAATRTGAAILPIWAIAATSAVRRVAAARAFRPCVGARQTFRDGAGDGERRRHVG